MSKLNFADYLLFPKNWDEDRARRNNNGCGTSGWKGKLVPDTIYKVNIKPACGIHDDDYATGTTKKNKLMADIRFLGNMIIIIIHETTWKSKWMNLLRFKRALKYFMAVYYGGDAAFFEGKTNK